MIACTPKYTPPRGTDVVRTADHPGCYFTFPYDLARVRGRGRHCREMTLAHDTDRIDGGLIGLCGLSNMALEVNTASGKLPRAWYQRSEVPLATNVTFEQEPGYTFDRNYWGQRFASEAAARVFEYASSTMPVRRIVSVIRPDNTPSLEIARRRGARQENKVMLMGQETGNSGPLSPGFPHFKRSHTSLA